MDWEWIGKDRRQSGADTQINHDTLEDLVRVRRATRARVLCRINGSGPQTEREVAEAIGAGADEILLPMVRMPSEVEAVLEAVRGSCGVGILIETVDALEHLRELAALPLSRVYVGLNDLAIESRSPDLFGALVDGTLERIRSRFRVPFGCAALTVPERGTPVPCRLLIGEMARLGCAFSFLRRSFHRDVGDRDMTFAVARLRGALVEASQRPPEAIARDRAELERAVRAHPIRIFEIDERVAPSA